MAVSRFITGLVASFAALLVTGVEIGAVEPIRAQVKSKDHTVLSAGITAKLSSVHVDAGESVARGEKLVSFACEHYIAAHSIAKASVNAAQARHDTAKRLLEFDSVGPLEVDLTGAELEKALGERTLSEADLAGCQLYAPYNAIIIQRFAQPHQFINRGEPLLELYSPDALEIHLVVPSLWLTWLKVGTDFMAEIDELEGVTLSGHISRVGGVVDPVSQTVEVFGAINDALDSQRSVLPGMSGWATFADASSEAAP